MKATLEFNLPEDEDRFKIACRSLDYFSALIDIRNAIREHEKYDLDIKLMLTRIKDSLDSVGLDDIS